MLRYRFITASSHTLTEASYATISPQQDPLNPFPILISDLVSDAHVEVTTELVKTLRYFCRINFSYKRRFQELRMKFKCKYDISTEISCVRHYFKKISVTLLSFIK
jgi:hypothetical protein